MESDDEAMWSLGPEMVMCSTCSGFVMRKNRSFIPPDPGVEVVNVVTEAEKMRDLMKAVLLHGPLQEIEPAEATKKQWQILRRRRMIMMETKRCPACSRSLLEMRPTCSRSLSEKPTRPDEEDKAMVKRQGGKERKKQIATEDEAMVAGARSVKKSKRSREEGNGSSRRLKKKKAKSENKEGSRSKKKAKRSSEMEGSGPKEVETEEGIGSKEAKMKVRGSAGANGKTKMVTRRLDKMCIAIILRDGPRSKPYTCDTINPMLECIFASDIRQYEVDCEFHEYLRRQSLIRGYAEYQLEVTDDEDE